ncbi:MAG: hypothetical protein ACI843_000576 [Psychrobacter glaciei]|jgi:uncharacterized protein (TIGR01777 family)
MNVLISGASGLIGSALVPYLEAQGHSVFILHRNKKDSPFNWDPDSGHIQLDSDIHLDAVINLNGVNIGDQRWSPRRKQQIIQSRTDSTDLLARSIAKLPTPPTVFLSASAIGFYGETGSVAVNENSPAGSNFLSQVVSPWEQAALPAQAAGIRTVFMRSGVVITPNGGALKKMLLPFKLGLGGKVGSGKQYMSWISLSDEIRAMEFLLNNDISGPVNLTAPAPVSNQDFTKALGHALNRPTVFPMPEFVVKALFGEMGDLLLLGSSRVLPAVLLEKGFSFKHNYIDDAFRFEQL